MQDSGGAGDAPSDAPSTSDGAGQDAAAGGFPYGGRVRLKGAYDWARDVRSRGASGDGTARLY